MNNINDLECERSNLINKKMKLDRFFSLYLDKFETSMNKENYDSKVWKLYKEKLKEYSTTEQEIRNVNYWLSKGNTNV